MQHKKRNSPKTLGAIRLDKGFEGKSISNIDKIYCPKIAILKTCVEEKLNREEQHGAVRVIMRDGLLIKSNK